MPRNHYPRFMSPASAGPWSWRCDGRPQVFDLPRDVLPGVLLQAARKAYAMHFNDPPRAEAFAIHEAGKILAMCRDQKRDDPEIAAAFGLSNETYQAALRAWQRYALSGEVSEHLHAYRAFLDETNAAAARIPPGPQQLRAVEAALADWGSANALWRKKFRRDDEYPHTAAFLASLQEKLARELPEPECYAFLRDCAAPGLGQRRMIMAFHARFNAARGATR